MASTGAVVRGSIPELDLPKIGPVARFLDLSRSSRVQHRSQWSGQFGRSQEALLIPRFDGQTCVLAVPEDLPEYDQHKVNGNASGNSTSHRFWDGLRPEYATGWSKWNLSRSN